MGAQLTRDDIALKLESFKYTKLNVSNGDAPYDVKQRKLADVESAEAKLRKLRDALSKR
jgi:hypothetical protein